MSITSSANDSGCNFSRNSAVDLKKDPDGNDDLYSNKTGPIPINFLMFTDDINFCISVISSDCGRLIAAHPKELMSSLFFAGS